MYGSGYIGEKIAQGSQVGANFLNFTISYYKKGLVIFSTLLQKITRYQQNKTYRSSFSEKKLQDWCENVARTT